ncbi:glycerophosphodiester phosphodiesterase family protein [bacterium]|nr:glycerophosphodiester phosphodiesterase family protein [bacterium]
MRISFLAILFVLSCALAPGCSCGDDDDDTGAANDDAADDDTGADDDTAVDDDDAADDDETDDDTPDDDSSDDDTSDDDAGDDDCVPLYPNVLISAHRGGSTYAPENSLQAMEQAFARGATIVEMDVRDTADDEFVLMHDDTVNRTTNGDGLVSGMTLAEIKALELNRWMYPWIDEVVRVPTFGEAMQLVASHGGQAYVDLKTDAVEGAMHVLIDLGLETSAFVYSGNLSKLDRVRAVSPDIRIQPPTASVAETQALLDHFDPDPEHIELNGEAGLSAANVALIKSVGATISMDSLGVRDIIAILGYPQAWTTMMEEGVDIISTDFPGALAGHRDSLCE